MVGPWDDIFRGYSALYPELRWLSESRQSHSGKVVSKVDWVVVATRDIDEQTLRIPLMVVEMKRDLEEKDGRVLQQLIISMRARVWIEGSEDYDSQLDPSSKLPRFYDAGQISKHRPLLGLSVRGNQVRRVICVYKDRMYVDVADCKRGETTAGGDLPSCDRGDWPIVLSKENVRMVDHLFSLAGAMAHQCISVDVSSHLNDDWRQMYSSDAVRGNVNYLDDPKQQELQRVELSEEAYQRILQAYKGKKATEAKAKKAKAPEAESIEPAASSFLRPRPPPGTGSDANQQGGHGQDQADLHRADKGDVGEGGDSSAGGLSGHVGGVTHAIAPAQSSADTDGLEDITLPASDSHSSGGTATTTTATSSTLASSMFGSHGTLGSQATSTSDSRGSLHAKIASNSSGERPTVQRTIVEEPSDSADGDSTVSEPTGPIWEPDDKERSILKSVGLYPMHEMTMRDRFSVFGMYGESCLEMAEKFLSYS